MDYLKAEQLQLIILTGAIVAIIARRLKIPYTVGLVVASMVPLVIGYALGVVPWRLAVAVVAPIAQLVLAVRAYKRHAVTAGFCIGLTWLGGAILVVYHAWNWLGLPGT